MDFCPSCGEPAFFAVADLCYLTREIEVDACCETNLAGWIEAFSQADSRTRNSTEWATDLLFKKPWTISRKAEFMIGIGLEWVHVRQNGKQTNSISGDAAGDFMFWPAPAKTSGKKPVIIG